MLVGIVFGFVGKAIAWPAAAGALVPAARSLSRRLQRVTGVALTVLLASAALTTAGSFPGSLAWTAWPFRPAYVMVTDSNVDWGLDLRRLADELRRRGIRNPTVLYFGGDDPGSRLGPRDSSPDAATRISRFGGFDWSR